MTTINLYRGVHSSKCIRCTLQSPLELSMHFRLLHVPTEEHKNFRIGHISWPHSMVPLCQPLYIDCIRLHTLNAIDCHEKISIKFSWFNIQYVKLSTIQSILVIHCMYNINFFVHVQLLNTSNRKKELSTRLTTLEIFDLPYHIEINK